MKKFNKILIGGYDFEQKIHRGITFYGKALVKTLKNYDIGLLTSSKKEKERILYILNILRQLNDPNYLSAKKKLIYYIKFFFSQNYSVLSNDNRRFDNRLNYLRFVKYFYNIPYIYDITSVQNRFFLEKPLNINLKNVDLLITTSPMNIKTNIFIIQTLHDVIPLNTLYHPPQDSAKVFFYRIKNMLKYSDKVIAISNYSKEECLKIFPKYHNKIVVTHQPIPIYEDEKLLAENSIVQESILNKYQLKKDSYLFYVGVLEKRKNIKSLIESYLAVSEKIKIPLVLAGSLGFGNEEFIKYLKDENLKNKVIYLNYINNIEKLVLLKNARAFLFPSFNEGFGLPPLESMMMGTPVLTSNISALPEVCGKGALYIDPYNIKELAEGILEITLNEQTRNELKKHFSAQIEKFSFKNFQKKLEKVLETL